MSDLISRQALMKEFSDFVRASNSSDFAQTPTWNDAVSLVGSMPSTQQQDIARDIATIIENEKDMRVVLKQPRWIPCSERLPDEDFWSGRGRQFSNHVIVTIVNHANDDEHFTDMAQTVDGIWQLSHDVDGDCSLPNWCEVIAWMPLPKPYKGEEP